MHAFLTAKVASVDPAFLSSIQQAWICAEAEAVAEAESAADDCDFDDGGSILRVVILES